MIARPILAQTRHAMAVPAIEHPAGLRVLDSHPPPDIGTMNFDLTDEETAALAQELHDIVENDPSVLASHPHAEGHTRQAPAGAGSRALVAAEGVCATAGHRR